MMNRSVVYPAGVLGLCLIVLTCVLGIFGQTCLEAAITLEVKDQTGAAITGGFRYVVEEDTAYPVAPGVFDPNSPAVRIATTYSPVVATGESAGSSAVIATDVNGQPLDPAKRYIVSVLPRSGYAMSGGTVSDGGTLNVTVYNYPLPPAQISVFVFRDNKGLSGIYDIPAEAGLAGFAIQIYDVLGQMTTDVFGNNLGATYLIDPNTGEYLLDGDGNPILDVQGNGVYTDATGNALIRNIPPGVYSVTATPTDGQPWIQTLSLGTPKLPVWVKAGEPPFFNQAGLLNRHVYVGFILPFNNLPAGGTATIKGKVVNNHSSAPPSAQIFPGPPVPNCYVGLNSIQAGQEVGLMVKACNPNSNFVINNVPAGTYQLVMWDKALDNVMDVRIVTVAAGQTVNMGNISIMRWFGTLEGNVFFDADTDGFKDPGEVGMANQVVNLRFRDGSIFQSATTNTNGFYSLTEIVPFGKWLVAEVDFLRYKPTGATTVVDNGGQIPAHNGWVMPSDGKRNPQPQASVNPNTGNNLSRTETGPFPLLLEGILVHVDQNNRIDWGRANYQAGENGGISGIVFYGTTRAENDPLYAAGDPWEPGVPRVQVNLYQDANRNGIIDDLNGDGFVTLADVDNYPFGNFPGPEDIDRNYPGQTPGVFHGGDAVSIVYSDSADDNPPTGCVGPPQFVGDPPVQIMDCAETPRTYNQVRQTIFDGGYLFLNYVPGGIDSGNPEAALVSGTYIAEVVPPPGYDFQKEEDKNVDFGDQFIPVAMPFPCVGTIHTVPDYLSMDGTTPTAFAGQSRPYCDKRQVTITSGLNAAADFHIFTMVPKAGRIIGLVLDPFANATNPNDPNYGGPLGLASVPVSVKDFLGNEIARTYTDLWGGFEVMVPSTNRINVPTPSGVSPNIVELCGNDPGLGVTPDPYFKPQFGTLCFRSEVFPARTAPPLLIAVTARAAFTGSATKADCESADMTPGIYSVGPSGPYVPSPTTGTESITITSLGSLVTVPNPDYPSVPGSLPTITRDFGFGPDTGNRSVTVGGTPLIINSWGPDTINATLPAGLTRGQLIVTRGDNGRSTPVGITFHVGGTLVPVPPGGSIQDAIDTAPSSSIVLVPPGEYMENLLMWKPLVLQGWGAGSTTINAGTFDEAKQAAWMTRLNNLIDLDLIDLVPGQRPDFYLELGAGITVLAQQSNYNSVNRARIDGFTITNSFGANSGGGILVNGYAHFLQITNNIVKGNQGGLGGGIRIGWPSIVSAVNPSGYQSAFNDNISIHHNQIRENGSLNFGGGLSIFNGSDNYAVTENSLCANYSPLNGGGIEHFGLSNPGLIAFNKVVFNEAFGEGGGIHIAGEVPPAEAPAGTLGPGAGSVTVNSNLIQGNIVFDDGGGMSIFSASGQDVQASPGDPANWFRFNILNNMIVNNVSGFTAGGINLADTVNINIVHNTIARNDTTGTSPVFVNTGALTQTTPMAAGIVARATSPGLAAVSGMTFSNPLLDNNILRQNRSFYWNATINGGLGGILPNPTDQYWDLQVLGTPTVMNLRPRNSVLSYMTDPFTGFAYAATNTALNPEFVLPYFNTIEVAPGANALANFPTILPLTITGNYHITSLSPAISLGRVPPAYVELQKDYDGQTRPNGGYDSGADEYYGNPAIVQIYSISGKVLNTFGAGISGVTIRISRGATVIGTVVTNAQGKYTASGLPNGVYTVTPFAPLTYTYNPVSRNVTINGANVTGQNLRAF